MTNKTVKYVAIGAATALAVFIAYHYIAGRTSATAAALRNQQLSTATNPAKPGGSLSNPTTISTAGLSSSVLNSGIFSSDTSSTFAPSGIIRNSGTVNSDIFSKQM